MAGKFYAVRVGRTPGIYLSWDECKKNVDGFSGIKASRRVRRRKSSWAAPEAAHAP